MNKGRLCLILCIAILALFVFVACDNEVNKPVATNEIITAVVQSEYRIVRKLRNVALFWVNEEHSDENKTELVNALKNSFGPDSEVNVDDDSIEIKTVGENDSSTLALEIKMTNLGKKAKESFENGAKGNIYMSFDIKDTQKEEKYKFTTNASFIFPADPESDNIFTFSDVTFDGTSYVATSFSAVMNYLLNQKIS
jgi:hypothetical protein